jgi:short-subunit dehydrogenase
MEILMATTLPIILITGATSGIGRLAALKLSETGQYRVFATGRDQKALLELRGEATTGARLDTIRLDVTDAASVTAAREEVDRLTNGYGVDILINNAGFGVCGSLEDLPLEEIRALFETNVIGMIAVIQAFLPAMRQRRAGKIINVSSLVGRVSPPFQSVYNASKHAVEALSDSLRLELSPFGIAVVLVEPGAIKTKFEGTMMTRAYPKEGTSVYTPFVRRYSGLVRMAYSFGASPEVVVKCLERVIRSSRPSARYMAPPLIWFAVFFKTLLPTELFDLLTRLVVGLWRKNIDRRP